jgi:GNAT superfamily N-acetyltransferase
MFARPAELSPECAVHWQIIQHMGIPAEVLLDDALTDAHLQRELANTGWIVDALFGTGLTGALRPPFDRIVAAINGCGKKVLAVDIPSGLDADTGQPLGGSPPLAVRAGHTATFVAPKIGFANAAAASWLGQVHVIDIGAPGPNIGSGVPSSQTSRITIRPTISEDFSVLLSMTQDTGFFKPIEIQALREVLNDYHSANHGGGHRCVTAEENGRLLGFAYFAAAAMTDRSWYLWWIVVRRDLHAKGIGGALLKHVEQEIAGLNGRVLFVETGSVPHYEPTRRFYLKHGYEQHALLKDYYAEGDSMVVFRKAFNEAPIDIRSR